MQATQRVRQSSLPGLPLREAEAFHAPSHLGFATLNFTIPRGKKADDHVQLKFAELAEHLDRGKPPVANDAESQGFRQEAFQISELHSVLDRIFQQPWSGESNIWISQNGFARPSREATHVSYLNMLFVDIDIAKVAAGGNVGDMHKDPAEAKAMREFAQFLMAMTPEDRGVYFAEWCERYLFGAPSFIIHSGGGLQAKWLFERPAPRAAKPVWDAMEHHLIKKLEAGGWPVDTGVRDVSRILRVVGTVNQKSEYAKSTDRVVRVVWVNGPGIEQCQRYDFNWLKGAGVLLPWSTEEVREFKAKQRIWDANRQQAIEDAMRAQAFVRGVTQPNTSIREMLAAELWHLRLGALRRLAEHRHGPKGVPEGHRNQFAWIAALALAWSVGSCDRYEQDLVGVIREIAPSFTPMEALASAASVTKRIRRDVSADRDLYKMSDNTFAKLLEITPEEADVIYRRSANGRQPNNVSVGAMGFDPMANLPYDEYKAETKRRQAAAAVRTNEVRQRAGRKSLKAELLPQVLAMLGQGKGQREIAFACGISQKTVSNWLAGSE